jgi:hypothetical protein
VNQVSIALMAAVHLKQMISIIDFGRSESFNILEPQDFDDPAHCNEPGMAKIIASITKPTASLLRD